MAFVAILAILGIYYFIGVMTMLAGSRLLHGPRIRGNYFWDGGYLWPILLPFLVCVWFIAALRTIANWPHGSESS